MYEGCTVAVVVPAYNECERIGSTVRSVPKLVDSVVVVDDGSSDGTSGVVEQIERSGLVLMRHEANRGVGAAIMSGYQRALCLGADVVAVMAGDNQMDPDDLPRLLDPVVSGEAGYAKGNRFLHSDVWRSMPPARIAGNIVLSVLTRMTSGYLHVFDSQCGYTAIHRSALHRLDLGQVYTKYGYCNDLLAHLNTAGVNVRDVAVRPVYNGARSGIRILSVVGPMLSMLFRSFVKRKWNRWTGRTQRADRRLGANLRP
jgi:glycosyltransferase involved in cell wall biosynthesis